MPVVLTSLNCQYLCPHNFKSLPFRYVKVIGRRERRKRKESVAYRVLIRIKFVTKIKTLSVGSLRIEGENNGHGMIGRND
jgi:hypothetical protein